MSANTATKDFPDWMGPMLIKELRQGMKARAFELSFTALQIALVLVFSYHALLYAKHGEKFNASGLHAIFWLIVGVQLWAITPLRALGGLASEKKSNTLELIFMTGLTSWRIALGKWASLMFQALLFVLAVLPYAFLRYFFGGVNLAEDLITLGAALLLSGLLTAVTLAISGLPLFFRIGAMGLFGFGALVTLPSMVFSMMMRGSMMSFGIGGIDACYWGLLIYNFVLLACAALGFAASSIAPLAENHAMRQRLNALAAALPVPLLLALRVPEEVVISQLIFFGVFALAVTWVHLSVVPPALRVQVEPFSRRGNVGFAAGTLLQPGWPSALVFLVFAELLMIGMGAFLEMNKGEGYRAYCAVCLMAGAALLTPVVIWRLVRKRAKFVLVEQTVILIACGSVTVFVEVFLPNTRGFALGDHVWTAFLPPFGFWAMLDEGLDLRNVIQWLTAAAAMFAAQVLLLMSLSGAFWARLQEFHADIRASRKQPVVVDGIPA